MKEGMGKYCHKDGDVYEGMWRANKEHGGCRREEYLYRTLPYLLVMHISL